MKVAVAIATYDRRDVLSETLMLLGGQTQKPDHILIAAANAEHVDQSVAGRLGAEIVTSKAGLPIQRNAAIERLLACGFDGVLLFIDDDYFLATNYIERLIAVFEEDPDLIATTGHVLADGIGGPGFSIAEGKAILAGSQEGSARKHVSKQSLYGCNMVIRFDSLKNSGVRFDENLPLYGWLEDVDMSGKLERFGKVVDSPSLKGVHLGIKVGRTPGRKLGYSQIANPLYLLEKGTIRKRKAWRLMGQNIGSNLLKSLKPERYIDRRGRFVGNLIALLHLITGRLHPKKAADL